jgi:hypothetical protein
VPLTSKALPKSTRFTWTLFAKLIPERKAIEQKGTIEANDQQFIFEQISLRPTVARRTRHARDQVT